MALRSSRASFNFLTSLIEYEGAWTDRDVYGVPYVEAEPERPGSFGSVLSTILHELTHLASFRTTRLGWVTHAAASRLLKQWRHGETPVFAGTTAKIIGTMVPILEGLATYAQLDLDGDDTPLTLYSAPSFYARATNTGSDATPSAILRAARLSQVAPPEDGGEGLLNLLYRDTRPSVFEHNLYLFGYLWVKAVAASLIRRCGPLAPPSVMLPLLIRIVCDHPALLNAHRGDMEVEALLPAIQRSVLQCSTASLTALAEMLRDEAIRDRIDHLHVADFLISGGSLISYATETFPSFQEALTEFEEEDWDCFGQVRNAAHVHFTSRTRGMVRSIDEDARAIVLDNGGTEVTIKTVPIERLWAFYAKGGANIERLERTQGLAREHERSVFDLAAQASGSITLAKYFCLSYPHDSGVAIWDELGNAVTFLSFVPEALDSEAHAELLRTALSFSIEQRLRFAKAIEVRAELEASAKAAVDQLLATFISGSSTRELVSQGGIAVALEPHLRAALDRWALARVRELPTRPSQELLLGITSVVDLAGFNGSAQGMCVDIEDLFPTIR